MTLLPNSEKQPIYCTASYELLSYLSFFSDFGAIVEHRSPLMMGTDGVHLVPMFNSKMGAWEYSETWDIQSQMWSNSSRKKLFDPFWFFPGLILYYKQARGYIVFWNIFWAVVFNPQSCSIPRQLTNIKIMSISQFPFMTSLKISW